MRGRADFYKRKEERKDLSYEKHFAFCISWGGLRIARGSKAVQRGSWKRPRNIERCVEDGRSLIYLSHREREEPLL